MSQMLVIDLNIIPCECGICEAQWEQSRSTPSYGIARYEDMAVPDSYEGAWGGMEVCPSCFATERLLRSRNPDGMIEFREIKKFRGGIH